LLWLVHVVPRQRFKFSNALAGGLQLGPRLATEIAEDAVRARHAWRTVWRAADDLGVLRSGGPGSIWELPEALREE
jgi:hypothetical protein